MYSRFFADQRGGVAPMFALAIVPIIGVAGAAVDYSRAESARSAMFGARCDRPHAVERRRHHDG